MSHPTEITEAWQALATATGTPAQPSPVLQAAMCALEEAGFLVQVIGTQVFADLAEPVDRDGQTFLHGSLRIEQVA